MAKVDKTKPEKVEDNENLTEMITVADLATEYDIEAKDLRVLLRANGFKAPEVVKTEAGGFGPRSKYVWPADSKEIKQIRALIEESIEDSDDEEQKPAPKAEKKPKK